MPVEFPITPDWLHLCTYCEGEGLCTCDDPTEWEDRDREEDYDA